MIVVEELLLLRDVMGRGLAWCHLQQQQDCQGHPQRQALCCGNLKQRGYATRVTPRTGSIAWCTARNVMKAYGTGQVIADVVTIW